MAADRPAALALAWLGALLFATSLLVFLYAYFVTFGRAAPPGSASWNVLTNVALFTLFALHHSVLARSRAKALIGRLVSPELERTLYVWTASLLLMAVCLLWRPLPGDVYRIAGPLAFAGYGIQIAGLVLTARSSSSLGVLDLAGVRAVLDAGDARTAPRGALQTSGLYSFVRHPLYFAWVLLVFGAPHMTLTRFVFAAVSTLYLALAIPFEERGLIGVFGEDYRRYRRKVRWRMLPGVY